MSDTIKVRTKHEGDYTVVKMLVRHPMETGIRKDSKGELIPAHFIKELTAVAGGKTVFSAHWGTGIAANPYISFKFKGAKPGDRLQLSWTDNKDVSDTLVTVIE